MKRQFLTVIAITALCAAAAFAQAADTTAKAEQIIKQARAAIGDEGKLKNLQSLSANGTQRTMFGDRQNEQELQLDILLPDKIMRTSSGQIGANISTYNGGQLWQDFVRAVGIGGGGGAIFTERAGGGGGGDRVFIGGGPGGFGGQGGPGGAGGALGADNPMAKYFQQNQRRDLLLPLIGILLYAPPSAQVQYSYLGEAPGPEGSKLDAVNAKNADGLNLVLYFSQATHQLVGIRYKQKQLGRGGFGGGRGGQGGQGGRGGQGGGAPGQPQGGQGGGQQAQGGQGGGQPGQRQAGAQGGQPGQPGQPPQQMTPEERERMLKQMMDNFEKAPEVDFSWAFSDYKSVGGLNLPHRLTRSQGGQPNEEWEISKYKINPKLSADKFVKKEKPTQ